MEGAISSVFTTIGHTAKTFQTTALSALVDKQNVVCVIPTKRGKNHKFMLLPSVLNAISSVFTTIGHTAKTFQTTAISALVDKQNVVCVIPTKREKNHNFMLLPSVLNAISSVFTTFGHTAKTFQTTAISALVDKQNVVCVIPTKRGKNPNFMLLPSVLNAISSVFTTIGHTAKTFQTTAISALVDKQNVVCVIPTKRGKNHNFMLLPSVLNAISSVFTTIGHTAKTFQTTAISALVDKQNVVCVIPTKRGKSHNFMLLPSVLK